MLVRLVVVLHFKAHLFGVLRRLKLLFELGNLLLEQLRVPLLTKLSQHFVTASLPLAFYVDCLGGLCERKLDAAGALGVTAMTHTRLLSEPRVERKL